VAILHEDFADAGGVGGTVPCPRGKRALAGGAGWRQSGRNVAGGSLQGTSVALADRGWFAGGQNNGDITTELRVTLTCVRR
jgi:hypothetical protein